MHAVKIIPAVRYVQVGYILKKYHPSKLACAFAKK
jgi:hypothetical protein